MDLQMPHFQLEPLWLYDPSYLHTIITNKITATDSASIIPVGDYIIREIITDSDTDNRYYYEGDLIIWDKEFVFAIGSHSGMIYYINRFRRYGSGAGGEGERGGVDISVVGEGLLVWKLANMNCDPLQNCCLSWAILHSNLAVKMWIGRTSEHALSWDVLSE